MVAEGRAKEFSSFSWQGEVPNPQSLETFERSKLDWDELPQPPHAELFDWHRRLIALRGLKQPGKAKAVVKFSRDKRWLRFTHQGLLAVFNLSPQAQRVPLPPGEWELQLRSDESDQHAVGELPAHATFIYASRSTA